MNPQKKIIIPLVAIFIIFSVSLFASKSLLLKLGLNYIVLIVANGIFFLISLVVFFMQQKALLNTNPNVFVRSVMGGMLLKMFVVITTVIAYRLIAGNNVSKTSVFAAMFLYLVYLAVEVAVITKLNKRKNA
ncbi:MAG: hypothetical protein ABIS01_08045 [Ferruginibacter sp.]